MGVKMGGAATEMPLSQQRAEFKQVLPWPQKQRKEQGVGKRDERGKGEEW